MTKTVVVRKQGLPGPKGDKGDPGDYSPGSTDVAVADGGTGASTASAARTNLGVAGLADPNVYTVGQAWGQDVRRYGTLGADASTNTATLNSAFANHADWRELLIPVPIGAELPINDTLVLPECHGKHIRMLGTRDPVYTGGHILQMASARPIFHWSNILFGRAMTFDLALRYNTQQSDPASVGFLISPVVGGVPHDIKANVSVEYAYDGFKCVLNAPGGGPWNFDLTARIWETWHTGLEMAAGGSVPSKFNLFISNTGTGLVPTGPALKLWRSESTISWLDIEGWVDNAVDLQSGTCTIDKLHIEHHKFNSSNPQIFNSLGCQLRVQGGSVYMNQSAPGTITGGYATVFYIQGGATKLAKLYADDIDLNFPSALAGNVAFLDGASGIDESYVGPGVKNYGTKLVDIPVPPVGGYSFYDAPTKYRRPSLASVITLVYGTTVATVASPGSAYKLTVTDTSAFTISNPTGPKTGEITYDIINSSGGAMGAITWGSDFKLAGAFTNPANTKRRTITFYGDNTNWIEKYRAAADI